MRQILVRFATMLVTVFLVCTATFFLTSLLPGDPALQLLGNSNPSPEAIKAVQQDLGLNRPIAVRYVKYLNNIAHGDFGRSYRTRQPVLQAIGERLPVTVEIGIVALLVSILLAVPLGILSAYRANGVVDRVITTTSFGLLAVPSFLAALLLLYLFAVYFQVFPATGWTSVAENPVQNLRSVVLPATALGIGQLASYTRVLRSDMIATLQEDFISMARAKGLPTWRIMLRHALRPSSFSLVTVVGLQVGSLIGGAVIVEQFFALPGVGRLLYDSIAQRDLVMVQGVVLFLALATVFANFAADLLYTILDPRIRRGSA